MTESKWQYISLEIEDGLGRLTLNRPPLNILNIAMIEELEEALAEAAQEPTLRLLLLQAEGKLFSAGVDIGDHTAERVGIMIPLFDGVCQTLATFPAPTLAAVQGHALGGGCELVLCCDLSLAVEGARLGQPEIKLATFAPIASMRLPAMVGYPLAAELLLTGKQLEATEAAGYGLINRAVPAGELNKAVNTVAGELLALSASALRLGKQALRLGAENWDRMEQMESLYLKELMSTEDVHEGLAAYEEKRSPAWRHR